MSEAERCPQCGGRLTAGSVEGLCPRCLLTAALRPPAETAPENLPEPGCQIGSCRIVRLLGEGGMGLVYLAEQEEPIARQVALKIIKLGMDTRAVLGRFQSEQQALALMEHPNIAQVYEAGSNAQGRPYFVMEYVPGIPITQYCDLHRLGTRQRLELFLQVVNGVQHAHQKGVIHRDLKPSNVLVMERDGEAVPKIIDFGLAKATEKTLTEESVFTEAGVLIGTPEYMSPEQASLGKVSVDTRTDVYSLGVLLYELLVGAAPFESRLLRSAGYDEIRRIIREDDPPTPAARLLTLGAQAAEIAHCRATEAGALRKQVRGELDWITMRALEKDCARRYPSASEMAADVQHYLRDEPVTAGPAGRAYKLRKFVRKNRLAVAAVGLIAVSLIAGLAVSTLYYIRAERQKEFAQRQERLAEQQKGLAEQQKGVAEQQKERAERESSAAERQRARAEHESYTANLQAAELFLRDNQYDDARKRLQACEPTMRNWEWRHLWYESDSSIVRLSSIGEFHNSSFASVIGFSGSRMCWNTQTTVECWEGPGYAGPAVFRFPQVLGMSNDGTLAVTGGDEGVRVVEVASGKSVSTCGDCKSGIYPIAGIYLNDYAVFSPDGTRIAWSSRGGGGTIVWDSRSGRTLARLPWGPAMAFSLDGQQLALNGELWSVEAPQKNVTLNTPGGVLAVAFSPDGASLAAASVSGAVRVWNLKRLSDPMVLATGGPQVQAIAFSPDGRLVAATGADRTVRIWLAGKLVASLPASLLPAQAIAFSPDGTRLVAAAQHQLAVWDESAYGGQIWPPSVGDVAAIAVSPDSALLAIALSNGRLEVRGMNGTWLRGWWAESNRFRAVAFSPDGKRLATGGAERTAHVWDATSGAPGIQLRGHNGAVTAVAFSPDGDRLATGSGDRTVRVWDAVSGRAITTIKLKDPVKSVTFSPDGGGLLVHEERKAPTEESPLRLWNATTGALLRDFRTAEPCGGGGQSQCAVSEVSFSPDGRRLVGAVPAAGAGWVWDVRTGAVLAKLPAARSTGTAVFSPDGSRIVMASLLGTGPMQIWDAVHYEPLLTLRADEPVSSLRFSSDGSLLLGLTGGRIRTWKTTHPKGTPAAQKTLAVPEKPPYIRLATLMPSGTSQHVILQQMGHAWRQAPGGGVNLIIFAGGVLGDEADNVRRMQLGQLQAGVLSVAGLSQIDKAFNALSHVPMTYRSLDEVDYVLRQLRPELDKRLRDKGFVALSWQNAGWVRFFSKEPVLHPADLKNLKLFAWSGDNNEINLMKALGFQPVPLASRDILPGLQKGLIGAIATTPCYASAYQVYGPAPHMLDMNWTVQVGATIMSAKAWESIPAATREGLQKEAEGAGAQMTKLARDEAEKCVQTMVERGLKTYPLSPEIEAEWRRIAEDAYANIRGSVVPADIFDKAQRLLADYRAGKGRTAK